MKNNEWNLQMRIDNEKRFAKLHYVTSALLFILMLFPSCQSKQRKFVEIKYTETEKMKTFIFQESEISDSLLIKEQTDEQVFFNLIHKSENQTLELTGIAINPDPDGNASLEELDPLMNDNALQMYIYKEDDLKITLLIPYEYEEMEEYYVGIELEASDSIKYGFDNYDNVLMQNK